MVKRKTLEDPYDHSRNAQTHEVKGRLLDAESAFKKAIAASDALPVDEYRDNLKVVTEHLKSGRPQDLVEDSLDVATITKAYHELLAMPFLTRIQLAGFYARQGNYDRARELCEEAFDRGVDAETLSTPTVAVMERRAGQLTDTLNDIIGPEEPERLFNELFDRLDVNRDGYVDDAELRRALLDIDIDEDGHSLVRFLLHNYEKVMQSSRDQIWFADFLGISKSDLKNYQQNQKERQKRVIREG